jgi:hypothetical protein
MIRKELSRALTVAAIATLGLAGSVTAFGQTTPAADTYKVNYFSNANDGYPTADVYIDNPGTSGGNLCAMIYVFAPDQQMAECCGCNTTPDGLLTLSVDGNLTSDPLTPVTLHSGVIKIVSSTGAPTCDPRKLTPTPALRAWGTHIQTGGVVTETEFLDATLSSWEVNHLQNLCKSIVANGSGYGVCNCGNGGAD